METLICFSHLRWDGVWQRPQHLMTRFAKEKQVIFWEEPIIASEKSAHIVVRGINPEIVTPVIPFYSKDSLSKLLKGYLKSRDIDQPTVVWYYTPMMLDFTSFLKPKCIVYDCMDELRNFKNAPPKLLELEDELLQEADLVFTGGHSLYLEKQKKRHRHIFPFPSSVDKAHFRKAIADYEIMPDQTDIPYPRVGYSGVLDERLDLELMETIARERPNYNFVYVGPTVKIDKSELPKLPNIHYLGQKKYEELPYYIGGWNACIMPFALNDATRFISPTKTPEYLAAERAVVSTAVPDVVYGYSGLDCVFIGDKNNFSELIDKAIQSLCLDAERKLATMSWDKTYEKMSNLIKKFTVVLV